MISNLVNYLYEIIIRVINKYICKLFEKLKEGYRIGGG